MALAPPAAQMWVLLVEQVCRWRQVRRAGEDQKMTWPDRRQQELFFNHLGKKHLVCTIVFLPFYLATFQFE